MVSEPENDSRRVKSWNPNESWSSQETPGDLRNSVNVPPPRGTFSYGPAAVTGEAFRRDDFARVEGDRERTTSKEGDGREKMISSGMRQTVVIEDVESSHYFELITFIKPTNCDVCRGFIWGISNQGYRCKGCKLECHGECRENAANCFADIKVSETSHTPDADKIAKLMAAMEKEAEPPLSGQPQSMYGAPAQTADGAGGERSVGWGRYTKHKRKTVKFRGEFRDPLSTYNHLFGMPSPLDQEGFQNDPRYVPIQQRKWAHGNLVGNTIQNEYKREMEEIYLFRMLSHVVFQKFDPTKVPALLALPSKTTSAFGVSGGREITDPPHGPTLEEQTMLVHFHFPSLPDKRNKTAVRMAMGQPIHRGVKEAVSQMGRDCGIQNISDAVLRRIGYQKYLTNIDVSLSCFEFAVEALEKRRVLQFVVHSKSHLLNQGVVLEREKFERESREDIRLLLEKLSMRGLMDDISSVGRAQGCIVEEEILNVFEIKEKYDLRILEMFNIEGTGYDFIPYDWFSKKDKDKNRRPEFFYFIEMTIFFGDVALTPRMTTVPSQSGMWSESSRNSEGWLLETGLTYSELPPESRLCITVFIARKVPKSGTMTEFLFKRDADSSGVAVVGSITVTVADHKMTYRDGVQFLSLWPKVIANPAQSCLSNPDPNAPILCIQLPSPPVPIVRMNRRHPKIMEKVKKDYRAVAPKLDDYDKMIIERLLNWDPLKKMTKTERQVLWGRRHQIRKHYPDQLHKVLLAFEHFDEFGLSECRALIDPGYGLPFQATTPYGALELLDCKCSDTFSRQYAVRCLTASTAEELSLWLLQLIQALKYENSHCNALGLFLLHAALHDKQLGFSLFWMLVSELKNSSSADMASHSGHLSSGTVRCLLYLDTFLFYSAEEDRRRYVDQLSLLGEFTTIAKRVQGVKLGADKKRVKKERSRILVDAMGRIKFPPSFALPTDPDVKLGGLALDKCKAMTSAAVPLWLTFRNEEDNSLPMTVIYKVGDDLRKDILVLQTLRLMNHFWVEAGLHMRISPYQVVMTGEMSGFVQVVTHSVTCADIHKAEAGVRGALKKTGLLHYLEEHNRTHEFAMAAVNNFICSLSGYCVATYILGIGDRHNDNIMVQETGSLFHIDFGFILGDYLKFLFFERETAPFVLTPEFVKVMGGENSDGFKRFKEICRRSYLALRRKSSIFMALFSMMLGSGVPGLSKFEDIYHLRKVFHLDLSENMAAEKFEKLIYKSLRNHRTRLNFAAHILAN